MLHPCGSCTMSLYAPRPGHCLPKQWLHPAHLGRPSTRSSCILDNINVESIGNVLSAQMRSYDAGCKDIPFVSSYRIVELTLRPGGSDSSVFTSLTPPSGRRSLLVSSLRLPTHSATATQAAPLIRPHFEISVRDASDPRKPSAQ